MSSSFWSGEFYFNGIYSDTYNVCIVDFDSNEKLKQIGSNINLDLSEENSLNGRKTYIENNIKAENITIQLCRTDDKAWTEGDIISVYNWLFQKDFKRFQTVDYTSGYNLCYYLKAVRFSKFLNPYFRGYLEIEFMSYDAYCYSIPVNNFTLSSGSGTLNNYSNVYNTYKPKLKIIDGGNLTITNNTNGTSVQLSGIGGETIVVDCAMGTVVNSNGDNRFYLLTDYNLLELERGNNNISVSGSGRVEFICEFPIII